MQMVTEYPQQPVLLREQEGGGNESIIRETIDPAISLTGKRMAEDALFSLSSCGKEKSG